MAINFHCKQCDGELQIREEDSGKRIRCPRCGMISEALAVVDAARPSGGQTFDSGQAPAPVPVDDVADSWSLQTPTGEVYGPVPRPELDLWEHEGRISADCLVQRSGQSHWQSSLVLYPHLISMPRAAPPGDAQSGTSRGRRARSRRQPHRDSGRRRNNGPAVLALGILGIFLVAIPVFAMIAWAMGATELRAMERGEASTQGRVLVDVGYYLGIIGSLVGIVIFLGCCLLIRA